MANEIIFTIKADSSAVESGLKKTKQQAEKTGDDIHKVMAVRLENSFDGLRNKIMAVGATLVAAFGARAIVNAARESEDATNALSASLAQIGKFSKDAVSGFEEYAKRLQQSTGYSDDLIVKNSALLVSLGELSGQGLERASKAALDFATARGVDMETSFNLMAKAAAGSTDAFSKYGIKVSESIPVTERFSVLLGELEKKFGGLSEARLNTFSGALLYLTNVINDLQEQLGNLIIKSPVARDLLKFVGDEIKSVTDRLILLGQKGDPFGDILKQLLGFAEIFGNTIMPALEIFVSGFRLLVQTVAGAVQEFIVIPIIAAVDTLATLGYMMKIVSFDTAQSFHTMRLTATEALDEINAKTMELANNTFDTPVSDKFTNIIMKMQDVANNSKAMTDTVVNNMSVMNTAADDNAIKWTETMKSINKSFTDFVVKGISFGIQTLAASLVKGGDAFKNFGAKVLNMLGALAIQIGETLLAAGIGMLALKFLDPTGAIIAGVALIALGGILQAIGGGGATDTGVGAGGGVAAGGATPGAGGGATSLAEVPEAKPQTKVDVIVQGNILDRRQTGLEIAEIINESFGSNGVVIAGVA